MKFFSKKFLTRVAGFTAAAALLLNLSACVADDGGQSEQQRFDAYLDTLPAEFISPQSLDVNYLFYRPADFGIEEALLELPYTDKQGWDEGMQATRELLDELNGFDAAKLDESSQLTLSILQDYLQRQLLLEDFFYLDNNYLGSFIGFQAQLPLLLNEFHIENQHDLDSYYHVLETCGDAFSNYAAMEQERQEHDTGMSRSILDKVIEQCAAFADGDVTFLIESTEQKIDAADFLSDAEKDAAKEKCAKLINEDLCEAYRGLGEALSLIEAPDSDLGLASQPGGQEYYEALLQQSTGVDMTVPEVKEYLENKYQELLSRAQVAVFKLYQQQPDRIELLLSGGAITFDYGDFSSAEEVLEHLKEACKADYPPLPELHYEVKQVAESMKDNFSPAAYLSSRIDAPQDSPEAIYLNGEFDPSLFTTLSHEGYPGHMYQHVYFRSLQLPAVRYLIGYNGYSEGWATYVEHNSIAYLPSDDRALLEFNDIYEQLTNVLIALSDIGIHYEGWDKAQYAAFMSEYFGELPAEMLEEQYALNLETPTNYLQYFLTGFLY
ncbi:MAG: DUF885 family protein, partial [Oscillospiraceae bacterium]|nr:DUF885 family protein [Oscillospiraceae bacterium]